MARLGPAGNLAMPNDGGGRWKLKLGLQAQGDTARRTDGVSREQPSKVDDVEYVGKVLAINLQMHLDALRLVNIGARRGVHLEGRIDTAAGEVDPIEHLLAVLGKNCGWIAVKIKGQAESY